MCIYCLILIGFWATLKINQHKECRKTLNVLLYVYVLEELGSEMHYYLINIMKFESQTFLIFFSVQKTF